MPEVTPPLFLNVSSFYGADELGLPYRDLVGEGVLGYTDLRVSQRGAGANMSVDVSAGAAWIIGDTTPAAQPQYRVRSDGVVNLAIGANASGQPRLDMVVAEVLDATFTGVSNLWRLRVVAGTGTAGATLDTRSGAATMPDTAILLADVLVANGAASIADAVIRDRRPYGRAGVVPAILTKVDMVAFEAAQGLSEPYTSASISHSPHDTMQSAALMYLPRRIVSATKIRWAYAHDSGTALSGNYVLALFDASGRAIVNTGTVAFTGAASSRQARSETITATTFEAGYHYVFMGLDTAAGTAYVRGVCLDTTARSTAGYPNIGLGMASGSLVVPTTLAAFTDTCGSAANWASVPYVALSVG